MAKGRKLQSVIARSRSNVRVARDRNWRWFCGGPRASTKTGETRRRETAESSTHEVDDRKDQELRNKAVKVIETPEKLRMARGEEEVARREVEEVAKRRGRFGRWAGLVGS